MVWGGSRTKPRAPCTTTADYFCVALFFALRFFLRVGVGWTGWAGVVGGIKFLARSAGRQVIQKIKDKEEDWGCLGEVRVGSGTKPRALCGAGAIGDLELFRSYREHGAHPRLIVQWYRLVE